MSSLKTASAAIAALACALMLSGCGSLANFGPQSSEGTFVASPPNPAKVQVNNAAWLVAHGPYADDCWMYGWGCAPPGFTTGVVAGGPHPNPHRPTYVIAERPDPAKTRARRPSSANDIVRKP